MNKQSRKKARLPDVPSVAEHMEIDDDVAQRWTSFCRDNNLSESVVVDLKEVSKSQNFLKSSFKAGYLVGKLEDKHPTLSETIAEAAIKILEPESAESTHVSHRGVSITDGLETALAHNLDLNAFTVLVGKLFQWHEQEAVRDVFLAPYFAIVQSSGMGKTKLLVEFRKKYSKTGVCKMILCLDAKLDQIQEQLYFDHRLSVDTSNASSIVATVRARMDAIVAKSTGAGRLVLLFDEAQGLMKGTDESGKGSLVFRAIRWWLRQERDREIVAVFAGTTAALSNFFPPDPPEPGTSREKSVQYKNYKKGEMDVKKLYPPFFELNTVACLREEKPIAGTEQATNPGFPQATVYGRPLFAHYYLKGQLDEGKMNEFAHRLVLSDRKYEENLMSCYSVLGSRVQMGVVNSFQRLSTLINSGYACLVEFRQQNDSASKPVAGVTFMPDPLCATLAMRFMDEDWKDGALEGKEKKFWVTQAEKAFTTKLCLPDKGDAGEIFAALYMLFCGDVLRKIADPTLSSFAVSLDEWFGLVKSSGRLPSSSGQKEEDETGAKTKSTLVSSTEAFLESVSCTIRSQSKLKKGKEKTIGEVTSTVSFVQFCRNDFRSNSFCRAERLQYMYRMGLGSYAFKNCKAFDIDASIKVVESSQTNYHPLLVSVKNWAKVTKGDVIGWLSTMMTFLSEMRGGEKKPSAVCLIVLLGCPKPPDMAGDGLNSLSLTPFPAADVFRLVCVDNDNFGVSEAVRNLGAGSEQSEIYSSHLFIACENSPDNLLRKSSGQQRKVTELFSALKLSTQDNEAEGKPKHSPK